MLHLAEFASTIFCLLHVVVLFMRKLLALIVMCVIALCALPHDCQCSTPDNNSIQCFSLTTISLEDFCSDCGHTTQCCASKTQVPSALETNIAPLAAMFISTILSVLILRSGDEYGIAIEPLQVAPHFSKWLCARTYLAKQSFLI